MDAKTAQNASVDFAAVLTGTTAREEFEEYDNIYIGENILDVVSRILND